MQNVMEMEGALSLGLRNSLACTAAATVAIIIGMVTGFSWGKYLLVTIVSAVLLGGLLYTFRAMYKAGRQDQVTEQSDERSADCPIHLRPTHGTETTNGGPPTGEPYPHHEDYPESAGEDQGQLTSHLPGSTPLMGKPNRRP